MSTKPVALRELTPAARASSPILLSGPLAQSVGEDRFQRVFFPRHTRRHQRPDVPSGAPAHVGLYFKNQQEMTGEDPGGTTTAETVRAALAAAQRPHS
ncbi:hypothetical protein [Nonomuraea glycinis]|uniref:hypothetical protein n=1 Tax=Nonomuraea glycinis TaxID=2047744 RepID=UPI0033AA6B99